MATDVLSDEQIEQLLQEAEKRLHSKAGEVVVQEESNEVLLLDKQPESQKHVIPKIKHGLNRASYIQDKHGVAQVNSNLVATKEQRKLADQLRTVQAGEKSKKTNDVLSAGPDWFDLPKTVVTPQLKRDLQLIELRPVLDPHRHYKKNNRRGQIPTFSQQGTVIEGPTEWYSSRLNKKDRAKNFVEEVMNTEKQTGKYKRKYDEIQEKKTSGKKAYYQKLMEKRKRRK